MSTNSADLKLTEFGMDSLVTLGEPLFYDNLVLEYDQTKHILKVIFEYCNSVMATTTFNTDVLNTDRKVIIEIPIKGLIPVEISWE